MNQVKELLNIIVGSRLVVEGKSRTFAKVPMWFAALAALSSLRLTALTVLLAVAFGMRARIAKA